MNLTKEQFLATHNLLGSAAATRENRPHERTDSKLHLADYTPTVQNLPSLSSGVKCCDGLLPFDALYARGAGQKLLRLT